MGTVDLNHLAVFVAVAETGSYTEAARRLHLPKSTVSRSVAALEGALGVGLLHRTTRSVTLTAAGAALQERAAARLSALQEAVSQLPELEDEPSGELRITATADFGTEVLADLVAAFTRRYPRVSVETYLTGRLVDLVKEGFDAAFRVTRASLPDSSLVARRLGEVRLQLFAAPSHLAAHGVPRHPDELDQHAFVGMAREATLTLSGPSAAVVTVHPRMTSDEMFFIREVLRRGGGIGALPTFLADADVRAGTLVRVLPRWSMPSGTLWLVVPGGRHPPRRLEAFRAFVIEAVRARGEL